MVKYIYISLIWMLALTAHAVAAQEPADVPDSYPIENYREAVKALALKTSAATYPNVPTVKTEMQETPDPALEDAVFHFVDATEQAAPEKKPAMLMAADFMLNGLECPAEHKTHCEQLQRRFEQHKLSLTYLELGGGYFYGHELLWRVWREYPETEWGQAAFVLLLDSGWDTKGECEQGPDEFRAVIREGEAFLKTHPNSAVRPYVFHELGNAYMTWWALTQPASSDLEIYMDHPKDYLPGAEDARDKAIDYLNRAAQEMPASPLARYSAHIVAELNARRVPRDEGFRFFCVYD